MSAIRVTTGRSPQKYLPPGGTRRIYQLLSSKHPRLSRVSISLDRSLQRDTTSTKRHVRPRIVRSNPKRQDCSESYNMTQDMNHLFMGQHPQARPAKIASRQYFLKRIKQKPKIMVLNTLSPPTLMPTSLPAEDYEDKPLCRMSIDQIVGKYSSQLSNFQKSEIRHFQRVYFVGDRANKSRDGKANWGFDNNQGCYLYRVHDHLAYRYELMDKLGQGSFGQVFKCLDHKQKRLVAVKMIKNRKRFLSQASIEVGILQQIKQIPEPNRTRHLVELLNSFMFRQHQCIVFQLLSFNLYDLLKHNDLKGLSIDLIRRFGLQILTGVALLHLTGIIHCDIKPENILLKHAQRSGLKIIDFGSSCRVNERVYSYIQSRYYRAPEVIVGMPYGEKIDIWSLGCLFAELYLGYPIFSGRDQKNQLQKMISFLAYPPSTFLQRVPINNLMPEPGAKCKQSVDCIDNLIGDGSLCRFIKRCLVWDPDERACIIQLLQHPWIMEGLPIDVRSQHQSYTKDLSTRFQAKN